MLDKIEIMVSHVFIPLQCCYFLCKNAMLPVSSKRVSSHSDEPDFRWCWEGNQMFWVPSIVTLKWWMRVCQSGFLFFPLRRLSHQLKHYCFLMQSLVRMLICFGLSQSSDFKNWSTWMSDSTFQSCILSTLSRLDRLLSTVRFKANISRVFLFYLNKAPQWWLSCGLVEEPEVSLHRGIKRSLCCEIANIDLSITTFICVDKSHGVKYLLK